MALFVTNSSFARCSYSLVDEMKTALKQQVYVSEKIETGLNTGVVKTDAKKEVELSAPKIKAVKECLIAYKLGIAPSSCQTTLGNAQQVSAKLEAYVSNMSSEEIVYYKDAFELPVSGGYISGDATHQARVNYGKMEEAPKAKEEDVEYEDAYNRYFELIAKFEKNCVSDEPEVKVWENPGLNKKGDLGIATVEVYNSENKLECKFVTNLKSKNVDIEVPEQFNNCVSDKNNYLMTEIVWRDPGTGLLKTEYAAGAPDDFVTDDEFAKAKVQTKSDNETLHAITAIKESLDENNPDLNIAGMVKVSSKNIDYEDVASLDQDVLMLGYLCDWGGYVDPSNPEYQADYEDYLWYLNDTSVGQDFRDPLFASNADWYRSLYKTTLQNIEAYPVVKSLFNDFKSGKMAKADAYDWVEDSGAYYLCYAQYQYSWWDKDTITVITGGGLEAFQASQEQEDSGASDIR